MFSVPLQLFIWCLALNGSGAFSLECLERLQLFTAASPYSIVPRTPFVCSARWVRPDPAAGLENQTDGSL